MSNPYIPNTEEDRRAMLATIGVGAAAELFADIPSQHRNPALNLPSPLSEPELRRELSQMAAANRPAGEMPCFLGAGAYRHFIPSVVNHIISRGEFATAYTPYQPEISQGTLQTIFEFQSLVCELTGMDVSNASMYDGASALTEACLMAAAITGRERVALLSTIHPHYEAVVRTYAAGRKLAVDVMEPGDVALSAEHACLAVQQPNFFGYLEDVTALAEKARAAGALYIVAADPISLGLFRPPGEYGADIVVAEGQSLGIPLSFGGPYLGLFAARGEVRAPDAGSHRRPDDGQRGAHRLRPHAADARAAHPPRARDLQHLQQRATGRAGGDRLSLRVGQAGAAAGSGAVLSQGALRSGSHSGSPGLLAAPCRARSSRSSSCAARGRRRR